MLGPTWLSEWITTAIWHIRAQPCLDLRLRSLVFLFCKCIFLKPKATPAPRPCWEHQDKSSPNPPGLLPTESLLLEPRYWYRDSIFQAFWLACILFHGQCTCVICQVQTLISIQFNTWLVGHYHRTSFWYTRIDLFPHPHQWSGVDMDSCGFLTLRYYMHAEWSTPRVNLASLYSCRLGYRKWSWEQRAL